ncbi:uncharacterized protein FPRN_11750 [Fusarium proliferatum]|nr:uncharacterized protein FPRN_11750 [Fusarium proliferatum]
METHSAGVQSPMLWSMVRLHLINDTGFQLALFTEGTPKCISCSFKSHEDIIPPESESELEIHVSGGKDAGKQPSSLFLIFLVGDTGKRLIVWVWMHPLQSAAEIKTTLVDKADDFSIDLLEKLSQDLISSEEAGLVGELYCKLDYSNEERRVGLAANFGRFPLEHNETLQEYWKSRKPEAQVQLRDFVYFRQRLLTIEEDEKRGIVSNYMIAAGWGQNLGQSVHENITLAALIQAGIVPSGTTYRAVVGYLLSIKKPDIFEFFRGVMWNDDPACYLFNDNEHNNGDFESGADWLIALKLLVAFTPHIIWRSHYGDLQFLHAMGTEKGEIPGVTKSKIMYWLEIMYKLSVEDDVHPDDPINRYFGDLFTERHDPKGSESLRKLLMGRTTSYAHPIISRRALGSCFHLIQDSYALGHCQRVLKNPEDRLPMADFTSLFSKTFRWFLPSRAPGADLDRVRFKKGAPGRFSYIKNFHCYNGQSTDSHEHYDRLPSGEDLEPSDLSTFDRLNGARDAIDKCTRLAQFWNNKTRWEDGVRQFLDEDVFMMQDATDSDTNVDDHLK